MADKTLSKTSPADANPDSVQTIVIKDGKATAPKRRMATASAAWSAYTNIRTLSAKRDLRYGDIAGIFAGFPPTPPSVNINNGMPDLPNVNTKQFQAKVGKYVSTVNAVSSQNDGWAKVTARHPDPKEAQRRSACLTQYFNDAIKQWEDPEDENDEFCSFPGYLINSSARDTQMGLFGLGFGLWEDDIDFRWTNIETRKVLVPQGTKLSFANCPAVFIEDESWSVSKLWNMRNKPGWNNASIERALFDRVELQAQSMGRSWTFSEWVNYIRNNDAAYAYDFAPVRVVHAFTYEFDGTISHSVFCDFNYSVGGKYKDLLKSKDQKEYKDAEAFLFDKTKVAKRWQQVLSVFADNAGPSADLYGVKGFGDLIYDGCHQNNLNFNTACRGAILANTPMFEGGDESDTNKLDQIVITPMGILPAGLRLQQVRFTADVGTALEMFQAGTNIIDQNTRDFPQNQRTAGGEQPTATQVNADRADEAQFDNLQVEIHRTFLGAMLAEMYRRLAQPASKYPESWGGGKIAKKFREYCKKDGIPEEDLLKVVSVKANASGSSGNMSLDLMKADIALSVATPGAGQLQARKAKIAAAWGYQNVSMFVEDAPQPVPDDQQIDTENLLIQGGQIPTPFGWDDQEKHVQAHLKLGAEAAAAAQQMMETNAVDQNLDAADKLANMLNAVATHVNAHVELMKQMPRVSKVPTLYEQTISEAIKQAHNLEEMSQALAEDVAKGRQQQQPQMSPEMAKAQAQIQIDNAKAQADIARKDQTHQAKLGNMAETAHVKTQLNVESAQTKSALSAAQTQQNIQSKSVETLQTLAQKAAEHHQDLRHTEEIQAAKTDET
jgi:hypothetical protein